MKKSAFLFVFILMCSAAIAQVPQAFNYQVVVRNPAGDIISNQSVSFRISILTGSEEGDTKYSEIHRVTTNNFGLVNLKIGKGENTSGVFHPGGWGIADHFIKVEVDLNGGSTWTHTGTTQLLSVPYAFHAQTVAEDKVNDDDADPENEIQELSLSGNELILSKEGGTVDLSSIGGGGGGDGWGSDVVASDATLEGEGTSGDPLKLAQQGAVEGNLLKWNGSSWVPSEEDNPDDDPENEIQVLSLDGANLSLSKEGGTVDLSSLGGGSLSLPYSGSGSASGYIFEVENTSNGNSGHGIKASSLETNSAGIGIHGTSGGSLGTGVLGANTATTGTPFGVKGQVNAANGYSGAFFGGMFHIQGNTGIGVNVPTTKLDIDGQIKIRGGGPGNGKVLTSDASGLATWATPSGGGGLTLPFEETITSSQTAIEITNSNGGAIYGYASASWGEIAGLYGELNSSSGAGVWGVSTSSSGLTYGIFGESASLDGKGVYGYASSSHGETIGVYGKVESSGGYSGYFSGGMFYVGSNAGFGTSSPTTDLDVNGQVRIRGGSPGDGKVLTSDGSGLATWETPAGGGGLTLPYSGDYGGSSPAFSITHSQATGIYVYNPAPTGENTCLEAWTNSSSGIGVSGHAGSSSGAGLGVSGTTSSPSGVGVRGSATSSTGVTKGVLGMTSSSDGYSGYFDGGKFYISGNTGIGTTSPGAKLDIQGQIKIRGGSPGDGKVLTSDGQGLATWEEPAGGGGLTLPYSDNATSSSPLISITNNGTGGGILSNANGTSGLNYGVFGNSESSSGVGVYGTNNSTSGYPIGVRGQVVNSNGFSGYFTGGRFYVSGSTGIGVETATAKLDVNGQVKIRGGEPGAGKVLTSDASGLATWEDPSGGGSSVWSESGSNIYFNTGNVGIGTSTPSDKLQVSGDITLTGGTDRYIALPDDAHSLFIGGKKNVESAYAVFIITDSPTGGEPRLTVKSDKVGVNTVSPTQALDVNGNARIRDIGSGTYATQVCQTSDGTLTTQTSDIRLKENIKTLNNSLDNLMKLRGVEFTWKDKPEYGKRIGFIAQEMEEVYPELVFTNPTDGYKGINYAEVSAVLVEAVKELKSENDRLRNQNDLILERLEKLEASVLSNKPSGN